MQEITDMDLFLDTLNQKPEYASKSHLLEAPGDLSKDLVSRQVVKVALDKEAFYQALPGFLKVEYQRIDKNATYEDFSLLEDAADICEYHCQTGYFSVSKAYMTYVKKSDAKEIVVNIYGAEQAGEMPALLKTSFSLPAQVPAIHALPAGSIDYLTFKENSYKVIQHEQIDNNTVYVLNVNLPYEYYSKIPVMQSACSYDFLQDEYHFFDLTMQEAFEKFTALTSSKSLPGIYININDNKPNPIGFANLYLALAKLYRLPQIPASLIVTGMAMPALENTLRPSEITAAQTNVICAPYFVFEEA